MSTTTPTSSHPSRMPVSLRSRHTGTGRSIIGGFFLVMAGVHLGIVAADAETYRGFADRGLFPFVREGWSEIVMERPEVYGLLLMAGEVALGAALAVLLPLARRDFRGSPT